jgi:diguanylate cyclase (GGDEF)-like protein
MSRAEGTASTSSPSETHAAAQVIGRASLAGRLRRTFMLIGLTVSAASLATILSFAVSWVWLDPEVSEGRAARRAVSDVNAAFIDQETGLRGYLLTRDARFLEPYRRGKLAAVQANAELDAHASSVSELVVALSRMRAAGERWQETWAAAALEMPERAPSAQLGLTLFDAFRTEQRTLDALMERRIEALSRRARQVVATRVVLELAIFVSLLILAVRQHRTLREAIVVPVAALLRDIGRVRDGELTTNIARSGPSELRELGEGLNDMVRALAGARAIAESRDELVREHSNRLRQILDASREFSESLNLAYVVKSVCSSTMAVGSYAHVVVWLMEDDHKGLRDAAVAQSTLDGEQPTGSAVAWRAAKAGRIAFEEADGRVRFGAASAEPLRAIAIPLIVGARVVGALEARQGEAHPVTEQAFEVLEMLATHAATAIESARLNQVAEERSHMDPLTRLHNRRRLEEDLDAECKRCARYGRPLSFVMLDVDHFKAFNDTHGHPKGDVALQEVAELMGGAMRTTDSAYRYGGEEFCILLRETTADNAMQFAERLRQRIENRFANGIQPRITASFGVAEFCAESPSPRTLVEAADAAMYESKHAGRNRVALSIPPLPAPVGAAPALIPVAR